MTHSKVSDSKIYNRKFDAYPHVLMSFTLIWSGLHINKKEMTGFNNHSFQKING